MAQGQMGDIVKYGLLAAAGYFLWTKFGASLMATTPPAVVPIPPIVPVGGGSVGGSPGGGGVVTGGGGGVVSTGGGGTVAGGGSTGGSTGGGGSTTGSTGATGLVALLQQAAGTTGTLNADQWSYYYATLPGRTAIDPTTFQALFFPNGRPSDPSQNPQMTAAGFASAIAARGLSGGRGFQPGPRIIHVPRMIFTR